MMLDLSHLNIFDAETHAVNVKLLHASAKLARSLRHNMHHFFVSPTLMLVLFGTSFILYRFLIYPLFVSPLAKIHNVHPLAALTPLWMDWQRLNRKEVETIWAAFRKYGDYIRLGPSELAANSMPDIAAVHGHGARNLDKTAWYDFFVNYG